MQFERQYALKMTFYFFNATGKWSAHSGVLPSPGHPQRGNRQWQALLAWADYAHPGVCVRLQWSSGPRRTLFSGFPPLPSSSLSAPWLYIPTPTPHAQNQPYQQVQLWAVPPIRLQIPKRDREVIKPCPASSPRPASSFLPKDGAFPQTPTAWRPDSTPRAQSHTMKAKSFKPAP